MRSGFKNFQRKLAAESQEEWEARLEDLRARQQQRLATETSEEAEARLEDSRVRQQQQRLLKRQRLALRTCVSVSSRG